jgi:hypothetical protein
MMHGRKSIKKHQDTYCTCRNEHTEGRHTTLTALCSRYAKVHIIKLAGALKQVYFSVVLSVKLSLQMQSRCRVTVTFTGTTPRRTRQYASLSESAAQIATLFRSFSLGLPEAPTM